MSFASPQYLPYLALVIALFQFLPVRWRMGSLLVASWIFYADWSLDNLPWLLASTFVGHATALAMASARTQRERKLWLAASLVFHLGMLVAFKYARMLLEPFDLELARDLPMPLGLSFFTFQVLSYSFDVYRSRTGPCRSWTEFALFVAFFPQLVAGPIERVEHLVPQLRALQPLTWTTLQSGALAIAWGLAKKLVFADRLRLEAEGALTRPESFGALELLLRMVALAVVLYADFSAYTDIARGSAKLFGVELVENFRRPFVATTPVGYWQRWHISLYTWLVDYVQVPLARSRPTRARLVRNSVLVVVLVGLWHGASWNFVLWGLANGALVALYLALRWKPSGPAVPLSWLFSLAWGALSMVLFFTPDLAAAARVYRELWPRAASDWLAWSPAALPIAAALAFGFALQLAGERWDLRALAERVGLAGRLAFLGSVAALTLFFRVPESPAFIYFQF